jgi:hypothetical protein
MKLFRYFTWPEIKDICKKLESCEFRHPKEDFNKAIGELNVMKLVDIGFLKDSPKLEAYWIDYYHPCYEYGKLFRSIANYVNTPFWLWVKIYVLQLWRVKCWWQRIRIACGHHYDWQDYANITVY